MSTCIECVVPESLGLSSARLGRISAYLKDYVESGKLPGYLVVVTRRGQPVYLDRYGWRDVEARAPVEDDTIFRIYSMTKPITSVALMSLYERGVFQLDSPVSAFIPAFKQLEVFESGDRDHYRSVPAEREMRISDLLTHTSGLTYGFMNLHPVDAMYRARGVEGSRSSGTLHDMVETLGELPLLAKGNVISFDDRSVITFPFVLAGHALELQRGNRCPGLSGGSPVRYEPGRLPGRTHFCPAGHDRHGVFCA